MPTPKTANEIRAAFIAFFEERGHHFVRSSPVVPVDDPTLLFTNAGMNQFKDIFLAKGSRDYNRAVNSQKCIRASGKHNDLEDVGRDNYHHTFFEMLGNWSFGDYFKRDAIAWAWELLVDKWGLDGDRMYATVFEGSPAEGLGPDDDAEKLWLEVTPLPPERVLRCSKKDNFWEMGDTGPCGPCSEMHYDLGPGTCPLGEAGTHECAVNVDGCWRFIELWNLVFIQYNRQPGGALEPLPDQHVDTGMGLERIVRVMQGKDSNYGSDIFTPVLEAIAKLTGVPDGPGETGVAFRVIADHVRALTFAISDGALPSNEGRGYVLRRMLRRAARFGKVLGMQGAFIYQLVPVLAEHMGDAFPELRAQQGHAQQVIRAEEESFAQTLDRGIEIFEGVAGGKEAKQSGAIPGAEVFKLYDTYGFPPDLTRLMAEERGLDVDMAGFEKHMEAQRAQAKAAAQGSIHEGAWNTVGKGAHSAFEGYASRELESTLHAWRPAGEGADFEVVLAATPFYAEGGGQVGDRGALEQNGHRWEVVDTRRDGDYIVHALKGADTPQAGDVKATVDAPRRARTTLNHTATHLMHAALREVLGAHVNQAGSVVHPDYLRFDFTHFERVSEEQLEAIERRVNAVIRQNIALSIYHSAYQDAIDSGVVALFGEKYGDEVRVVQVPGFSQELCGGCHVGATGDIGVFKIVSESGIATGVRRIVALTGEAAEEHLRQASRVLEELRLMLNTAPEELPARVEELVNTRRKLERELAQARKGNLAGGIEGLLNEATDVNGVRLLAKSVEVESMDELRTMADALRVKMKDGVALLGAVINGKASLLCAVGEDLVKSQVKAGDIVNAVAAIAEGRGGGPPHMATAGAKNPAKLPDALSQAPQVLAEYMAGKSAQTGG